MSFVFLDAGIQITGALISAGIVAVIIGVVGFLIRRSINAKDERIKKLENRIKKLEEENADQRVINQEQKDFKDTTKENSKGSESSYKEIMNKLDIIKDSQDARFDSMRETNDARFKELTESIHAIELRLPKP